MWGVDGVHGVAEGIVFINKMWGAKGKARRAMIPVTLHLIVVNPERNDSNELVTRSIFGLASAFFFALVVLESSRS